MNSRMLISFNDIPHDWNVDNIISGVSSEFGIAYKGLNVETNSIFIPYPGRFVPGSWEHVFLAETEMEKLIVWDIIPYDGIVLKICDGRELNFSILYEWGYENLDL